MSNEFVQNEMKKILNSKKSPENMVYASAWAIAHFKGINIKVFDVSEVSSLCDYNIIATAENVIQAKTIVAQIQKGLKQSQAESISVEGEAEGEWILLDMGDIMIHIFQENARDTYHLESLWEEAPQLKIPSEFYFSTAPEASQTEDATNQYF